MATLSVLLLPAGTAAAVDPDTGDVTKPEIVSLELQPAAVDVTDGPAEVLVTGRFTDEGTGVTGATLQWQSPAANTVVNAYGFELVSGTGDDGVYQARMSIPRGAAPGAWPIDVYVRDRVGNVQHKYTEELELAGLPGQVDVTSDNPDLTAPDILEVQVLPEQVDVRTGASSLTVRARVADDAAGVSFVHLFPKGPYGRNGGVRAPIIELVSGTETDGWWEGELVVDRYAHAGAWSFGVRLLDALDNSRELSADDLSAQGLSTRFAVESEEDVQAPSFTSASLSSILVDVSDRDQELTFHGTVTDDLSGVQDYSWGTSNVQFFMSHPLGQGVDPPAMIRTSGSALNGTYATTVTIPQHSATGLWAAYLYASDSIGNGALIDPLRRTELGFPQAVLVYNTPLPPLEVDINPGDATALVQWQPPDDDRGAEVTEYLVRELTQDREVRVDGDARSVVVPDLDNGVEHEFVVHAVNREGESDPSSAVTAVPVAGGAPDPIDPVGVVVTRLAGTDRVSTAIQTSQSGFDGQAAGAVVLTRSDDYADALAGTPLAARASGPLLITPGSQLDPRVLTEIRRVLPPGGTVYLLGGDKALSPAVASALQEAGYRVQRLAGTDRYETAVRVAEHTTGAPSSVLIATGRSFADALSAGAAAASTGGVVVLTDDRVLPAATAAYLQRQSALALAVGGPAASRRRSASSAGTGTRPRCSSRTGSPGTAAP